MKLSVDPLTATTGWVVNAPSTVTVNTFPEFIAGLNTQSLMFKFDILDGTRTAVKTYDPEIDVSDYEELIFSIWSLKFQGQRHIEASDFSYKITLNGSREYYIPTHDSFSDLTIYIRDIDSISSITFTPLHAITDWIIVSDMLAVLDEIPRDIYQAIQEHIEFHLYNLYGLGKSVGLMTGSTGDAYMSVDGDEPWLERYSVVVIDDGVNRETHQIEENDGQMFWFNSMYDGSVLLNDFSDADVFLKFVTTFGQWEKEIILPGIVIWNMTPEPLLRGSKLQQVLDTFDITNDNFQSRREGQILRWDCLIDCEARMYELIADMSKAVRRFIQQEKLWINGRRHDIYFEGSPVEIVPTEQINVIPKVQYIVGVEMKEDVFDRQTLEKTTTITFTPAIVLQGELP